MTQEQTNAAAGIDAAAQAADQAAATQTQTNTEGGEGSDAPATSLGEGVVEDQQPTDKQEDEGQGEEKKDEKTEENELFGKPEAYDYKEVKLPENMQLDANMTTKFNEYAAKLNLSQKGANDLMQMAVELTEQTQQQTVEAMGKLTEAKIAGYKQLLNTDSEVGGAKLNESIATANLAYDAFFKDEGLRELLAEGGLNVHPKFIKALKDIGLQMKNDSIHSAGGAAGEKKERQDILYPSMAEN